MANICQNLSKSVPQSCDQCLTNSSPLIGAVKNNGRDNFGQNLWFRAVLHFVRGRSGRNTECQMSVFSQGGLSACPSVTRKCAPRRRDAKPHMYLRVPLWLFFPTISDSYSCIYQKKPRARNFSARISGAPTGCANFMGAWHFLVLSAGKPPCPLRS